MKIVKKIILFFISLILILILISAIYSKYVKKERIIKIFGKAFFIVATGSMEPTICKEELLIISEKENYKKGDIVTYIDNDDFLITHRIIDIDKINFVTKGDANNIKDEECKIDKIQGKVIFHSKILGFFILYLLKPICIVYVLSIYFFEIIKFEKKEKIEDEQNV